MPTPEEQLIEQYFDAFNGHDVEGVVACFHEAIALVNPNGERVEGIDAARLRYEQEFATMPDAHCDLRLATGNDGRGVAESVFRATLTDGTAICAVGAEVIEFADGRIKEIRDYHHLAD